MSLVSPPNPEDIPGSRQNIAFNSIFHVMIIVVAAVLIGIEFLKYGMRQTVEVLNERKLCYLETRIKSGKSGRSVYDVMSCELAEAKFNSMVGKSWLVDRTPPSYESMGAASGFELLIPFETGSSRAKSI